MDDELTTQGPPGIAKDDIEYEKSNPNLARAVPRGEGNTLAEKMHEVAPHTSGTYPDIVEGSDSERTGTSWGVRPVEEGEEVETPSGAQSEGSEEGQVQANRNTGDTTARDKLR